MFSARCSRRYIISRSKDSSTEFAQENHFPFRSADPCPGTDTVCDECGPDGRAADMGISRLVEGVGVGVGGGGGIPFHFVFMDRRL